MASEETPETLEGEDGTFQIDADAHNKAKLDNEYQNTDLANPPSLEEGEEDEEETEASDEESEDEESEDTDDEEAESDDDEDEELTEAEEKFDAWTVEFQNNGSLSEETRQEVIDTVFADNVPDEIKRLLVESYEGGLNQMRIANTQQAFNIAGGEESYSRMIDWAKSNLSNEEIEAFDQDVTSDNIARRDRAIKGLYAQHQQEIGNDPDFEPDLAHSGTTTGGEPQIGSRRELVKLQRSEEYKTDPAYRAKVARMLEQSMATGKYLS